MPDISAVQVVIVLILAGLPAARLWRDRQVRRAAARRTIEQQSRVRGEGT